MTTAEPERGMPVIVPRLEPGELHLWSASVDVGPTTVAALEKCLSADERERADRRRRETDRMRYISTRGALRSLLAGYTGLDPAELCLAYGPQGKPEIATGPPEEKLRFNVSHSGALAVFAFTRGAAVGVDLERIRPMTHVERVAARVFPAGDLDSWHRLPADQRLEGFFARWTRLEAIAKLHGGGVWWLVAHGGILPEDEVITVVDITAPPGFAAAAAVGGPVATVTELVLPLGGP